MASKIYMHPSTIIESTDQWTRSSSDYFELDGELKLSVLHPRLLRLAGELNGSRVLDFGCGDGVLAARFARRGAHVVGVDQAKESIERAINLYGNEDHLSFQHIPLPNYDVVRNEGPFDLIIISMVLITVPDSGSNYASDISEVLRDVAVPNGRLLFGDSHPCYHDKSFSTFSMDLDPRKYPEICAPFEVEVRDGFRPEKTVRFTDFHRPFSEVMNFISNSGFRAIRIEELYDDVEFSPSLHATTRERLNGYSPPFILIEGVRS